MWAMTIQASAEAIDLSQSLANRRHMPSHAKVRSTTQRRGRTSKPLAFGSLDDLEGDLCDLLQCTPQLWSTIAAIGEDMSEPRPVFENGLKSTLAPSRSWISAL